MPCALGRWLSIQSPCSPNSGGLIACSACAGTWLDCRTFVLEHPSSTVTQLAHECSIVMSLPCCLSAAGLYGATTALTTSACTGQCAAGTYSPAGSTSCTPCPAAKFSATVGAGSPTACQGCPGGKFSVAGSGSCTNCSAGHYGPLAATYSVATCAAVCGPGQYSLSGAVVCTYCPGETNLPSSPLV